MSKQIEPKATKESGGWGEGLRSWLKGLSLKNTMTNRRLLAGLAVVLLGGAALWWLPDTRTKVVGAGSPVQVVGTLPSQDLAAIRGLVRRETWRGVLPRFEWWSIRLLPASIRTRASERVHSITVKADGTVSVQTMVEHWVGKGPGAWSFCSGNIYELKKGQQGWTIIRRGSWEE